eukprot:c2552_g1_i2.p1 GENE.c2552_g1_i2~~c2552_g1_i2.p1  ORF type:complete len:229 (-),score=72.48 c2552_g1_i2:118-804(-)
MGQIRSSRMLNLITFALAFDFQGMNCEVASPCVPCSVGLVSTECAKSQWVQKLSCISSPSLILFEVDSEVVDEADPLAHDRSLSLFIPDTPQQDAVTVKERRDDETPHEPPETTTENNILEEKAEMKKNGNIQVASKSRDKHATVLHTKADDVWEGDHLQQLDQDPQENLLDSSNSNNEDTVFVYQSCSPPNGMRDLIAFEVVMVVGVLWFGLRVAQRKRIRVKHRWS